MASTPLSTDFTAGQGAWTINDVELDGISYVWKAAGNYGMKASAYVSKAAHATESWLISPAFSLTEASTASLAINHAVNNGAPTNFAVKASADGATWTDLTLSAWPEGSNWTFIDATADLSAFAGEETVQIAFVYVSTTDLCPTWEVKTVTVTDDTEGGQGGEGGEVALDVVYGEAGYLPTYGAWQINLYKDYNEETYEVTYPDLYIGFYGNSATAIAGTYTAEDIAFTQVFTSENDSASAVSYASDLVIEHQGEGIYNIKLNFVGDDNVTYTLDWTGEVYAYNAESDTYDEITLDETGEGGEGGEDTPADLATEGIHTLTPGTDATNAAGSFDKIIDGIQLVWEGAYYNNENGQDFRVYANKTMTITAGAKIVKVEIAGLAKKDLAPTVDHGTITTGASFDAETTKSDIEDPLIVIEEIGATSVTLTCNKQMRAYIIRVTLEGAQGIEETLAEGKAVKVLREGNILIMKGNRTYTTMGQIVK